MSTLAPEKPMAKRDDTPVRVSNEALAKARIAAAYKGKTLSEYISDVVLPAADRDIEEGHAKIAKPAEPKPKPKR